MRTIRNLAWFLLAFTLTVWAGLASAQTRDTYFRGTLNTAQIQARTAEAVCQYLLSVQTTDVGWTYVGVELPYCLRKTNSGSTVRSGNVVQFTCPTSTPYFNDKSRQCVATAPDPDPDPPPGCPDDIAGEGTWHVGTTGGPYNNKTPVDTGGCVNGCRVDVTEVKRCFGVGGKDYCNYAYKGGGATCQQGEAPAPSDVSQGPSDPRSDVPPFDTPKSQCPKGTVDAGISDTGLRRCIGTGTDPKNKPPAPPKVETEKTETADDGTKTTTKTEVTTNSDGSKTTTTTVTITKPDGTKQVDQKKDTSKTPTNAPGKDDSAKDDEKYDLCKQNPHLTICQNSSVAGKCGETSCSGDAIQCATLRAAAAMQCQQQKDLEDLAKAPGLGLGNAIAQGSDPMQGAIDSALKGTEIDLSKPALDATGFVGAGACLAPITMTVIGRPVTASFDSVCQNIQPLRYAIMACAYILVYLLVSRSILQG